MDSNDQRDFAEEAANTAAMREEYQAEQDAEAAEQDAANEDIKAAHVEREAELAAEPYSWLDDPAERAWLIAVDPAAVLANAHRIYEFMAEGGMAPDSYTRELAFDKAAAVLKIDYEVLYQAWLDESPVRV